MKLTFGASWCVSFALLAVSGPLAAQAGVPMGPEFRVSTYTTDLQASSSVASDSSGNFVVVWNSFLQDGDGVGVFGQRHASSGAPSGPEFRVNTFTTGDQSNPSVASDPSGNFVVVWHSYPQDGDGWGVFGQRYASSGAPAGAEFRVNTYTTSFQLFPKVAADASGNFVVVWQSYRQDGSLGGVFGQRYASSGAPAGAEFRVNTYTTQYQANPSVATGSSGNFVVVWQSFTEDGSGYGVFGQRYTSAGAPAGAEFQINTFTTDQQSRPSVASDSSGDFFVSWQSNTQDGSGSGVFGQRYLSSGAPAGSEFRVNTFTTSEQSYPSVAADPSGNFVVVWQSQPQDGWGYGVFGLRYTSSGAPAAAGFRINTYTTNHQSRPSVAVDSAGKFVVVWQSSTEDGSNYGVFGQRYGGIVAVELIGFSVE